MARTSCLACQKKLPKRGHPHCPACGRMFRGTGWDGIEAHWRARHTGLMPYRDFWDSLCRAHRAARTLECLCCRKGIPKDAPFRQCPECALVLRGVGWTGIDAHWKARHADLASYDEFWRSLCPAHRGMGDARSGYLPFDQR